MRLMLAAQNCEEIVNEACLSFSFYGLPFMRVAFEKVESGKEVWPEAAERGVVLSSDSLYQRQGFNDGALLDEFLLAWRVARGLIDEHGLYSDSRDLLWSLVQRFLIPVCGLEKQDVHLVDGVHNPVRFRGEAGSVMVSNVEVKVSLQQLILMADLLFAPRSEGWLYSFSMFAAKKHDKCGYSRLGIERLCDELESVFSLLDSAYRSIFFDCLWVRDGVEAKAAWTLSVAACVGALN